MINPVTGVKQVPTLTLVVNGRFGCMWWAGTVKAVVQVSEAQVS